MCLPSCGSWRWFIFQPFGVLPIYPGGSAKCRRMTWSVGRRLNGLVKCWEETFRPLLHYCGHPILDDCLCPWLHHFRLRRLWRYCRPGKSWGRGRNNGTGVDGSSPEKWGSCWSSIISMMLRTSTLPGVDTFSFVTMDWLFDFGVLGTS